MFMLLPMTFLFTPFFYSLLGYHPEMPVFPFLVYLWFAVFLYLGMTVTFVLPKHKYLPYPIVAFLAFLCRNIITLPALNFQKTIIDGDIGYITVPLEHDDIMYYTMILFIATLLIGFAGIYYSKKTALEFVKRGNTGLFITLWIIAGIFSIDKTVSVFYIVAFAVFYFIVRNFASLNRRIEIYGERGAYNATGTRKIYAYYFITLLTVSVLPIIFFIIVVPFIAKFLGYIINFIISLITDGEKKPLSAHPQPTGTPNIPSDTTVQGYMSPRGGHELLVYNILLIAFLVIALILIIISRKHIVKLIKAIIEFFKMKMGLKDLDKNNIINNETIVKITKDKKLAMQYKSYLKKARKIRVLQKRYAFAYNCVFWNIIRLEDDLKESFTPEEVVANIRNDADKSAKYSEVGNLTYPYENIKYGDVKERDDKLKNMIDTAELLLKKILK